MAKKIPFKPPKGRKPSEEHKRSMWSSRFIPLWRKPATEETITATERKLKIKILAVLKKQLLIQNGGSVFEGEKDAVPMKNRFRLWMNAAIDGILPVEDWKLASDDHWFDSVKLKGDVDGLNRLVIVAAHSEAQLCLDYRSKAPRQLPRLIFVDICMTPTEVVTVCDSVADFAETLIKAKLKS